MVLPDAQGPCICIHTSCRCKQIQQQMTSGTTGLGNKQPWKSQALMEKLHCSWVGLIQWSAVTLCLPGAVPANIGTQCLHRCQRAGGMLRCKPLAPLGSGIILPHNHSVEEQSSFGGGNSGGVHGVHARTSLGFCQIQHWIKKAQNCGHSGMHRLMPRTSAPLSSLPWHLHHCQLASS